MFFKRLSRSRSNSQSYVDNYNSPHDSKTNSQSYDDKYSPIDQRPASSHQPNSGALVSNPNQAQNNQNKDTGMYPIQTQDNYQTPPLSSSGNRPMTNGYNSMGGGSMSGGMSGGMGGQVRNSTDIKNEAAPDLLTRAFNEAVRPYTTKLEEMENEIDSLRMYIEQLEGHRNEVHAWIDKRGLRPGKYHTFMTDRSYSDTLVRRSTNNCATNGLCQPTQSDPRCCNAQCTA